MLGGLCIECGECYCVVCTVVVVAWLVLLLFAVETTVLHWLNNSAVFHRVLAKGQTLQIDHF